MGLEAWDRNARLFWIALSVMMLPSAVHGQQLFQESFEAAPGESYHLTRALDEGFDFFGRFPVPDEANGARSVFLTGWDGAFGILSQDHGGAVAVEIPAIDIAASGVGEMLDLSVQLTSTDSFEPLALDNVRVVANESGLSAILSLAALASEDSGFDNYDLADGDGIVVLATIDGGLPVEIGRFSPPQIGANTGLPAGDLYLTTAGNDVGSVLTSRLTDYSFSIPQNSAPIPEPAGLGLASLALLGFLAWTRKANVS